MFRVIGVTGKQLRLYDLETGKVMEVEEEEATKTGLDVLPTFELNVLASREDREYYVLYALRDTYVLVDKSGKTIKVDIDSCKKIADKLINMRLREGELVFFDKSREFESYLDIDKDAVRDSVVDADTVIVPSYIRRLCKKAFKGSGIKYLKLPNVEVIEPKAFINSDISVIDCGNSLREIGYEAFRGCSNLNFIRGLKKLESVGSRAFANCENLQYFPFRQIRSEAISIGEEAFKKTGILSVDFTGNIEVSIGDRAFKGCDLILEVSLPGKSSIGDYAFYGCVALVKLKLPYALQVGQYAFGDTKGLSSVELNTGEIHSTAFEGSLHRGAEAV